MRSNARLRTLLLALALQAVAAPGAADSEDYRAPTDPPLPEAPGIPPTPPVPPCAVVMNGIAVTLDCNPSAAWVTDGVTPWAVSAVGRSVAYGAAVEEWGGSAAGSGAMEFTFIGSGTSALVHVDDAVSSPYHENVIFVVKGGPGGARWTCKHMCIIPDTGFVVSIDPSEVPPRDYERMDPAFPPTKGTITVTFA